VSDNSEQGGGIAASSEEGYSSDSYAMARKASRKRSRPKSLRKRNNRTEASAPGESAHGAGESPTPGYNNAEDADSSTSSEAIPPTSFRGRRGGASTGGDAGSALTPTSSDGGRGGGGASTLTPRESTRGRGGGGADDPCYIEELLEAARGSQTESREMLTVAAGAEMPAHELEFLEFLKFREDNDVSNLQDEKPEAPDTEDLNGCCVVSGSIIAECSLTEMRVSLNLSLNLLSKKAGTHEKNICLGDRSKDHFHVSVLMNTLQAEYDFSVSRISASEHRASFWRQRHCLLVVGELNFDFKPWVMKNGRVEWNCKLCQEANFGGISRIPGVHDDGVLHAVVVKDGKLYCSNMIDRQGNPFWASAVKLLPTKRAKCGQYRVTRNSRMAYLRSIRRVYLCEPNEFVESGDDDSNPNSR